MWLCRQQTGSRSAFRSLGLVSMHIGPITQDLHPQKLSDNFLWFLESAILICCTQSQVSLLSFCSSWALAFVGFIFI